MLTQSGSRSLLSQNITWRNLGGLLRQLSSTRLPLRLHLVFCALILAQFARGHLGTTDYLEFQAGTWQRSRAQTSPFAVPEQEDVTFVQSSIGVNKQHYSKDGPILIPIFVNRYFGDASERARQIETGGIPRTVRLIMPAWDVDCTTSSQNKPECDQVFFNDQYLGDLYGSNNTWKINIFALPIEMVNFPDSPGDSAVNWVRIEVDVNNPGNVWLTAINWAALMVPAPRPIMLVHGWMSDSGTWWTMRNSIRKGTGVPTVAVDLDPAGSVFANAYTLKYELAEWRERFQVQQFNILAHSKGGLDSRCYTNSNTHSEYAYDIHQIFQIATPNAGSRMADLLYDYHHLTLGQQLFLAMFISANQLIKTGTWHITTEFTKEFNRRCEQGRSRANLSVVTGRVPNRPFWLFNFPFLDIAELAYNHDDNSSDPQRWGDGVVSVASAHTVAIPRNSSPLRGSNCDHLDIIDKQATKIVRIFHDDLIEQKKPTYQPENYHQPIDYRSAAAEPPRRGGENTRDSGGITALIDPGLSHEYPWKSVCATWNGCLEPGKSADCEFSISQPQDFSLFFLGVTPDLPITVTCPRGQVFSSLEPNTAFGLPQRLSAEEMTQPLAELVTAMATLPLINAESGIYRVKLGPNPQENNLLCQVAAQEKIPSLNFRFWPLRRSAKVGSDFLLFCSGKSQQRLLGAEQMEVRLQAVREKDGEQTTNYDGGFFRDDGVFPDQISGDGIFTASFTMPETGNFVFFARADITPAPGLQAKASSFLLGTASASASTIRTVRDFQAQDQDGNGLFDLLQVTCELDIETQGEYYLCAELRNDDHQRISVCNSPETTLKTGIQEIRLEFPGREIFQRGSDGPYHVAQLALYEAGGNMLENPELDSHSSTYRSEPYPFLAFEHNPITILNTGRDWTLDKDGDGCPETIQLEIDFLISSSAAGTYSWSASLFDHQDNSVADAVGSVTLSFNAQSYGLNKVTFAFPTDDIIKERRNGPYRLGGIALWQNNQQKGIYLESTYQTGNYKYHEFVPGANILDVSPHIDLLFSDWTLNQNTGALTATATLTNLGGKNGAPLELVFWLVLPSDNRNRLCQIDGQTETGLDYLDVTTAIETKLPEIGNGDLKLDVGETVQFNLEVFSCDRSIPQAQIFSLWADPPPEQNQSAFATTLDDEALLLLVEKWHRNEITDALLLQAIKQWQEEN